MAGVGDQLGGREIERRRVNFQQAPSHRRGAIRIQKGCKEGDCAPGKRRPVPGFPGFDAGNAKFVSRIPKPDCRQHCARDYRAEHCCRREYSAQRENDKKPREQGLAQEICSNKPESDRQPSPLLPKQRHPANAVAEAGKGQQNYGITHSDEHHSCSITGPRGGEQGNENEPQRGRPNPACALPLGTLTA